MSDLIDPIVIPIDSSQTVTASKDLSNLGLAYAKMVQTVLYENKVLSAAKKASASVAEEAEARSIQKQIEAEQKLSAAKAKEIAKQQAAVQKQIQDEENARFASIRKQISLMENSKRLDNSLQVKALREEAAERERVAAAEKREADQLEYLNMKYDKAYAAAKLYKTVQDELNLAMSKGVGNADQLQAQLNKLEMEYAAFGSGTTDIKNRFVQQAAAVEESRKGVNKWGLLVQQTGYQAGDFLVQVQSGTNIFVAFGQQATQLVGILPMFATELGVSAVALGGITLGLSIAIPLITAVGAYFMRSGEGANKASKDIDLYKQSVSALASEIQKNQDKFNLLNFGGSQATANANAAKQAIEDQIKGLEKQIASEEDLLKIQSQGGILALSYAATRSIINSLTLKSLDDQKQDLMIKLDLLDAQNEAQRILNGGLSVAGGLQRAAVRDKQEELRAAKEHTQVLIRAYEYYGKSRVEGEKLAKIDFEAGVKAAATAAKTLADNLGVSLSAAQGIMALGKGKAEHGAEIYDPRSPNYIKGAATFAEISSGAHPVSTYGQPVEDKTSPTGTGIGGGGIDKIQALLDSLKTQTEVVDAWYEESQKTLQSASDKELEIIGGRHEAELRLETEHQQRMAAIKEAVKQNNLSIVLGSGAQILSALGAHNEKAAKMAKVFGAAQALADTYVGAAAALKLPFPANLAAAASIISAGLGFVSAIRSGGTASASGGGKSVGSVSSSTTGGQTAAPQVVMIQGLKPTDVFTGEQLSTLFDSLYKENRNRGMVFQVAR